MKYRTTARAIRENYSHIISLGYCEAQSLLKCADARAYTAGIYGWNFDVVIHPDFPAVAICTGYRGIPKATLKLDRAKLAKAEGRAMHQTNTQRARSLATLIRNALAAA